MESMLLYLFYGAIALSFPVGVIYLILVARLFGRLKHVHPEKYSALGKPTLFLNGSFKDVFHFIRFLVSGSYKELADPKVNTLAGASRSLLIVGFLLYAFCFIVVTFHWTVELA